MVALKTFNEIVFSSILPSCHLGYVQVNILPVTMENDKFRLNAVLLIYYLDDSISLKSPTGQSDCFLQINVET